MATNSKTPLCRRTPTITIIPNSRKMTFQSIPVSSEKKISWPRTEPIATIAAAPRSATSVRLNFSVTITTYASANTARASHAVNDMRSTACQGAARGTARASLGGSPGSTAGPPTRLPGTPGGRLQGRSASDSAGFVSVEHVALETAPHQRTVLPGSGGDRCQHPAQRDHTVEVADAVDHQDHRRASGIHGTGDLDQRVIGIHRRRLRGGQALDVQQLTDGHPVESPAQLVGPRLVEGVREVGLVADVLWKDQAEELTARDHRDRHTVVVRDHRPDKRYSATTRAASAPVV